MLTAFNEIDMSHLMAMRAEYKDAFLEKHGVKLGFMSCFIKAAAKALRAEPAVNAIIDGDGLCLRLRVSVAVSAPGGLVVPVLRDVDKMSFADVESTIASCGKKAREGTLSIDEMTGVPSPSPTAVFSDRSTARPSSTRHSPPSWACTPSSSDRWWWARRSWRGR